MVEITLCNRMALLSRTKLLVLRVAFFICTIIFFGLLALTFYAFYAGLSQWLRFRTPDNLGFGIGFGIFVIGVVPSFLFAYRIYLTLRRDRKLRASGVNLIQDR